MGNSVVVPEKRIGSVLLKQMHQQEVLKDRVKFRLYKESQLPFVDSFGQLKNMNKDDDVETDDLLVAGTQRSVLRNFKEAVEAYEQLK